MIAGVVNFSMSMRRVCRRDCDESLVLHRFRQCCRMVRGRLRGKPIR
jgi:hypothetical protein